MEIMADAVRAETRDIAAIFKMNYLLIMVIELIDRRLMIFLNLNAICVFFFLKISCSNFVF